MVPEPHDRRSRLIASTVDVVCAYVSNHRMPPADLPALIERVRTALAALAAGRPVEVPRRPGPAQVRSSITRDALISFLDGRPYRVLTKHLTRHGLSAEQYRARYGLPSDYPMVCPSSQERRSAIARATVLAGGREGGGAREGGRQGMRKRRGAA